jgi:hypothetical protein
MHSNEFEAALPGRAHPSRQGPGRHLRPRLRQRSGRAAFAPYYEVAAIDERTDPNQVFTLKNQLDDFHYYQQDVEDFAAVFFRLDPKKRAAEHGNLYAAVSVAIERFKSEPDEDRREDFRAKLAQYGRLYGMLAQMIEITDARLEKLYVFAYFLQKKLPRGGGLLDLGDDVRLDFYKLSKTSEGRESLSPGEFAPIDWVNIVDAAPIPVGVNFGATRHRQMIEQGGQGAFRTVHSQ